MADLGELLGTFVVGLAHARRMADEEATAIAEHYRTNPLLERVTCAGRSSKPLLAGPGGR